MNLIFFLLSPKKYRKNRNPIACTAHTHEHTHTHTTTFVPSFSLKLVDWQSTKWWTNIYKNKKKCPEMWWVNAIVFIYQLCTMLEIHWMKCCENVITSLYIYLGEIMGPYTLYAFPFVSTKKKWKTFEICSYFHNLVVTAIIKVTNLGYIIVCYKRDSSTKFHKHTQRRQQQQPRGKKMQQEPTPNKT